MVQVQLRRVPPIRILPAGSFPVVLTVSGPGGDNQSKKTVTVHEAVSSPVSGFSSSPSDGVAPLPVTFTDSSIGEITTWKWDFGDGTSSTEKSPTHTYTSAGSFPVVLTVFGPGGDNQSKKTVTVKEAVSTPVSGFSFSPSDGVAPLPVSFTDSSAGVITTWKWNFGDGTSSNEKSPTHTYTSTGSFPVVLTVSGSGGENQSKKTVTVQEAVSSPVSGFSFSPSDGVAPLPVSFTDSSVGDISSWKWDFGDGTSSNEKSPTHTYTSAGSFPVVLTVSGPGGDNQSIQSVTVTETVSTPIAGFSATPSEGQVPLPVSFTDSSTGDISSWKWNFGDGTSSNEKSPTHTYSSAGSFPAVLTVSGPGGESSNKNDIVVTKPLSPPTAAIQVDIHNGPAPLSVTFTDASPGQIISRVWDFGDGTTSTDPVSLHTYANAGKYQVRLTVTGQSGDSSDGVNIDVTGPVEKSPTVLPVELTGGKGPLVAKVSAFRNEGSAPLTVPFKDVSTGEVTSRKWDFGDGGTSTEQNPTHTYSTAGNYPVSLTVNGPEGEKKSDLTMILVTPSVLPPKAIFTPNPVNGTFPLTVTFTDVSTGAIVTRDWNFGDGETSTEQNPVHVYQNLGVYSPSLTVKGPAGESRSDATITVHNLTVPEINPPHSLEPEEVVPLPPVPVATVSAIEPVTKEVETKKPLEINFTADKTSGVAPLRVHLHPDSTERIDGYIWDLGDGNVSYDEEPVHIYNQPGTYQVGLTVSGPEGVSSSKKPGYITVVEPIPSTPLVTPTPSQPGN